jgi:hypothetical protein
VEKRKENLQISAFPLLEESLKQQMNNLSILEGKKDFFGLPVT